MRSKKRNNVMRSKRRSMRRSNRTKRTNRRRTKRTNRRRTKRTKRTKRTNRRRTRKMKGKMEATMEDAEEAARALVNAGNEAAFSQNHWGEVRAGAAMVEDAKELVEWTEEMLTTAQEAAEAAKEAEKAAVKAAKEEEEIQSKLNIGQAVKVLFGDEFFHGTIRGLNKQKKGKTWEGNWMTILFDDGETQNHELSFEGKGKTWDFI